MIIIGHRGAKGLAPENTLKSIQKAVTLLKGTDNMIEFDVRVTKDNIPVLHHNPTVVDASHNHVHIADATYDELLLHFPALTTLSAALDAIDNQVIPYIEVKPHEHLKPIIAVLRTYLGSKYAYSNVRFGSKSIKTLQGLHKAFPEVPTIVIESWSGMRAHWRARQVNATAVCMGQRWLWSGFIKAVKNSKYQLYTYTINDPVKAARWHSYGLAGVVTDYPDRFVSKD